MGWKREKTLNTGKHLEVENFEGGDLPAPWGNSANSTGKIVTDTDANRVLITDQAGKRKISQTNVLGQFINIWEITSPDSAAVPVSFPDHPEIAYGYQTNYEYDILNNLIQINQGEQIRVFNYSSMSRVISANNPETGLIQYQYDNNGNLTQKTDNRGVITTNTYDALNRVLTRNYSNEPAGQPATPTVSYTYDDINVVNSKGKLTKTTTANSGNILSATESTEFDLLGRVKKSRQTTYGIAYNEMLYSYNLSGALIEQTYPSGRVVKSSLDNGGGLAQVESKKNSSVGSFKVYANQFVYTASGAVSGLKLGNGTFESTQFNSRLQPIQIALGTSLNSTNLLKINYNYGTTENNGNILSQTIVVPTTAISPGFIATQNYTYDSLNRLKQATETIPNQLGWQQIFNYDRYGNRNLEEANTTTLTKQCGSQPNFTVCSADRKRENPDIDMTNNKIKEHQDGDGVKDYEFDGAGNIRRDTEGRQTFYDGENRQIQVKDASGNLLGEYFYDGNGKRIKKIAYSSGISTEVTIFVYDASGRTVAEYSTQVASSSQAKVIYSTNDNLGSPRINTDGLGVTVARHDYRPFGEEINRSNYGSDAIRKKFTGYERDNETNLDFAQARYHDYNLGRFTTPDPAAFNPASPQEFNRYVYVRNNPLKYIDPTGETFILNGEDADFLVSELERFTGYKLYRCKKDDKTKGCGKEGQVIIDKSQDRKEKNADGTKTSAKLAAKLAQVIAPTAKVGGKDKEFTVTINTAKESKGYFFDYFAKREIGIDDYKASMNVKDPSNKDDKGDNGAFVATQLGHVLEEYFQAETTNANAASPTEQFNLSHDAGKKFEGEVLSDFTGSSEGPRNERASDSLAFYNYNNVRYEVFLKSPTDKSVFQINRKPIPK